MEEHSTSWSARFCILNMSILTRSLYAPITMPIKIPIWFGEILTNWKNDSKFYLEE